MITFLCGEAVLGVVLIELSFSFKLILFVNRAPRPAEKILSLILAVFPDLVIEMFEFQVFSGDNDWVI